MSQQIALSVNGESHQLAVEPDTPLLYVLRNDLGLSSAKFGCGLGQCGACKVLIDGNAVPACQTPVGSIQDREVTTLEGLGTAEHLDPLQEAFIAENALQCGFCVSGMIISAKALLNRNPDPTEEEIKSAMADSLCRCGTYDRVLRAIRRAAGHSVSCAPYEGKVLTDLYDPASAPAINLPRPLLREPDLNAWVRINTDGTVTLFTGKVELGQDIRTSVAMIGADELDVSLERIRVVMADTAQSPNEGYTVSSMSLETSGNAIRYATAEVRQLALNVAYEELEAPLDRLTITDGTIADPVTGRSTTYWDLFGGRAFGSQVSGRVRPKTPDVYHIVGRPTDRLDLRAKVSGTFRFVQDISLPGMVHGRVVRPPTYGAKLVSADLDTVCRMPGVLQVVRDGGFLAVIAEREEQAVRAREALRESAEWEPGVPLPPGETLFDHILSRPSKAYLVVDGTAVTDPVPPVAIPEEAAQTLTATYCRPYHMHASLGPSAAVAQVVEGKLTVWTHSQGVYPLRSGLAEVLGLPEEKIHAIHVPGPGCYGHNGADDAALDAALLALAMPERPVSLKWMRDDEHKWEPYGAATVLKLQASLDSECNIIDWNHDVWGYAHSARSSGEAGTSSLLAAWYLEKAFKPPQLRPSLGHQSGVHRNAEPLYAFPRRRIVKHFLPDSPLRVSALRGLGYYANAFAIESFVDELAHAAGADPVAFRLHYLEDERARAVIEAAVEKAGERPVRGGDDAESQGRGIAFAQYKNRQSYVAVVVDLSVDRSSGRISLQRAVVSVDSGQIVNPDGLSNQLEGGFTQAASWTLKEQVTFGPDGISSIDWATYPILRFREVPEIETVLVNRPGMPYLGIGEGTHGPVPAAIGNAVFDAVGVRLRRIPFTAERVKEALEAG